ncbi:MAG TPA: hypothetical protein VN372_12945 [Methanospirillum sp.]|nr:hypothetical protein [Methanospirillum sp.]
MSCIALLSEYRPLGTRKGNATDGPSCLSACLHDLVGSDEAFISHLEAIHYLNFPGC